MKLPKYMRKKIIMRAKAQQTANNLQLEIEEWCEKNSVNLEYAITHVCLYTEPAMVALDTIERIEGG